MPGGCNYPRGKLSNTGGALGYMYPRNTTVCAHEASIEVPTFAEAGLELEYDGSIGVVQHNSREHDMSRCVVSGGQQHAQACYTCVSAEQKRVTRNEHAANKSRGRTCRFLLHTHKNRPTPSPSAIFLVARPERRRGRGPCRWARSS